MIKLLSLCPVAWFVLRIRLVVGLWRATRISCSFFVPVLVLISFFIYVGRQFWSDLMALMSGRPLCVASGSTVSLDSNTLQSDLGVNKVSRGKWTTLSKALRHFFVFANKILNNLKYFFSPASRLAGRLKAFNSPGPIFTFKKQVRSIKY